MTICTNAQSLLTEGSAWSLKKIGSGFLEKTFKGADERTDDGLQMITLAYPEPLAQVS